MKFVIFTDNNYNYRKPMADGLCSQLRRMGHNVILYDAGNYWLSKTSILRTIVSDIYKYLTNLKEGRKLFVPKLKDICFFNLRHKKEIMESDCIIVVDNCPNVYYKDNVSRIEEIREYYDGPIVNYDLHYMPSQGWYGMIKQKNINNFGLERFDWYLPASVVTEFAVPKSLPHIYNCIGFDLRSEDLYPEQAEFLAVLDFAREGKEEERSIQIAALKATQTKYICLNGKYTRKEIRSIYRRCNLYFTSTRESFSLPVLEVQLCGGMIATPYAKWLPAHFVDKDIYSIGEGNLGSNFIVYDNCQSKLEKQIIQLKQSFNAQRNVENFKTEYPSYFEINKDELADFCLKVQNKQIHGELHKGYINLNKLLNKEINIFN